MVFRFSERTETRSGQTPQLRIPVDFARNSAYAPICKSARSPNRPKTRTIRMAFDPNKALADFNDVDCSVQFWIAGAQAVTFPSLRAAVNHAFQNGGKWNEIEITVHLPREDIVYGTAKVHILIDTARKRPRR